MEISIDIMDIFINNDILFTKDGIKGDYSLSFNVYYLLNNLKHYKWDVLDFLNWIFLRETIEIISVQTPGYRARKIIEDYIISYSDYGLDQKIITYNINNKNFNYVWKKIRNDIVYKLMRIRVNYNIINQIDLEDADLNKYYIKIYFILKDFLLFFAKLYSYHSNLIINFYSKNNYIDSWGFIRSALNLYQKEYKYNFLSYRDINIINNDHDAVRNGIYTATNIDIEQSILRLENIIMEFNTVLDGLIQENVEIELSIDDKDKIKKFLRAIWKAKKKPQSFWLPQRCNTHLMLLRLPGMQRLFWSPQSSGLPGIFPG
ncbi:hypothetical protein ES703_122993 [subsurface metagenome]